MNPIEVIFDGVAHDPTGTGAKLSILLAACISQLQTGMILLL